MAENYPLGLRRIWYKSKGFQESLNVTIDFLSPSSQEFTDLSFTEKGSGLYFLDFEFNEYGNWMALIYENGNKVSCQGYLIHRSDDMQRVIRGNIVGR